MTDHTPIKEAREPKVYKCLECKKELDFSKAEWGIGLWNGMKTKTVICECGKQNNLSQSVKGKMPALFKGWL